MSVEMRRIGPRRSVPQPNIPIQPTSPLSARALASPRFARAPPKKQAAPDAPRTWSAVAAAGAAHSKAEAEARTKAEAQAYSKAEARTKAARGSHKRGHDVLQSVGGRTPPKSVSGFVLTKLLGRGSFGCVYLCSDSQTGAKVCVKIEYQNKDNPAAAHMSQVAYEHRLYESLHNTGAHRYVPRSICYGEESGEFRYMVMTLGGTDLTHIVRSYTLDEKLRVFANVLRGLRAFHNAGLLHRDVKPRNVLIKLGGARTDILLVDLGLAKRYSSYGDHIVNRRKATAVGTPRYASVNSQLFFENSRRDDLYSCVYAMVTVFGESLPWENLPPGDKASKTRHTVRLKRLSTPAEVCRGCPPCLARIYFLVQQLAFAQQPDYAMYTALVRRCMTPAYAADDARDERYDDYGDEGEGEGSNRDEGEGEGSSRDEGASGSSNRTREGDCTSSQHRMREDYSYSYT